MDGRNLLLLTSFALILAIVSPANIIDIDPLGYKPGKMPDPGIIVPRKTWQASLFNLTEGHIRDMNKLIHYQPGSPTLSDFFQQNPIPLNSQQCNTKFTYNEKLVYDVDDFLCSKDVMLPANFPTNDDGRSPFSNMFGTSFDFAMDATDPLQSEAVQYYLQLYDTMDQPPYNTGNFKKCSQKNGVVDPHLETDGYKVIPACYAKPVSYTNLPIAYRSNGKVYPCYIPQPARLEGVECFDSKREKSNKCTMGYITYHEYRCLPSNFITRRVPLVCPGYGMAVIDVRVPISCSCKMCYNCGNNFAYDAYSNRPNYLKL